MLDPNRIALDASAVGFRVRTKQPVNWTSFNIALQNQTDTIKTRREVEETPISVLHIMGGQGAGYASNEVLGTRERQQRQMNGYRIRSFTKEDGPIIPPKHHSDSVMAIPMNLGIPQYTKYNASAGEFYVSQFVEPLNAPLEQKSTLESLQNIHAVKNRYKDPDTFLKSKFHLNMDKSKDQIDANEKIFTDDENKAAQDKAAGRFTDRALGGALTHASNIRKRKSAFTNDYDADGAPVVVSQNNNHQAGILVSQAANRTAIQNVAFSGNTIPGSANARGVMFNIAQQAASIVAQRKANAANVANPSTPQGQVQMVAAQQSQSINSGYNQLLGSGFSSQSSSMPSLVASSRSQSTSRSASPTNLTSSFSSPSPVPQAKKAKTPVSLQTKPLTASASKAKADARNAQKFKKPGDK